MALDISLSVLNIEGFDCLKYCNSVTWSLYGLLSRDDSGETSLGMFDICIIELLILTCCCGYGCKYDDCAGFSTTCCTVCCCTVGSMLGWCSGSGSTTYTCWYIGYLVMAAINCLSNLDSNDFSGY